MSTIVELTPEQEARFDEFVEKWSAIALSTAAADRQGSEQAIRLAYQAAGLQAPAICWCDSPLSLAVTSLALEGDVAAQQIMAEMEPEVCQSIGRSLLSSAIALGLPQDRVGYRMVDRVVDYVLDPVAYRVQNRVEYRVQTRVGTHVGHRVWDRVQDRVGGRVWDRVRDSEWAGVRDSMGQSALARVGGPVMNRTTGAIMFALDYAHNLAFYDYMRNVLGLVEETDKLQGLTLLAQTAHGFYPFENLCLLCERPVTLTTSQRGDLHNATGPALLYRDGLAIFAWRGVNVPRDVIENPEGITAEHILNETNGRVRRVLIERYGLQRYIRDIGAGKVAEDDFGVLFRINIPGPDRSIMVLKVVNSTPDPDGSYKEHFLRVPQRCRGNPAIPENSPMDTAYKAVWWTFKDYWENGIHYNPVVQRELSPEDDERRVAD